VADFTFHHGGVSVPDIDEAIDWYASVLGFELEKTFYIAPARTKAAMIRKGPLRIELFEPEEAVPLPEDRRHPPPRHFDAWQQTYRFSGCMSRRVPRRNEIKGR
jgi:catechol 2,3-dioxygenase-like lactoylglutathione lyase family enzyme